MSLIRDEMRGTNFQYFPINFQFQFSDILLNCCMRKWRAAMLFSYHQFN